jgi:predicted ester cyclase
VSTEENKAAFRRIPEEVISTGNLELADTLIAADYVEHVPLPPGIPPGLAGFKAFFTALRAAFPDLHYTLEAVVAEGGLVAGHATVRGTHRGEFMGILPTGKRVVWTETHVGRFADGKLVEHWANLDQLGLLQQLGAIPAPGQPGA